MATLQTDQYAKVRDGPIGNVEAGTSNWVKSPKHTYTPLFSIAHAKETHELALLGDEGVDAGGLGVEEVGDGPLRQRWWSRQTQVVEALCTDSSPLTNTLGNVFQPRDENVGLKEMLVVSVLDWRCRAEDGVSGTYEP